MSQTITCQYCDSKEVSKPKYSAGNFAISMLLFGFPLPFLKKECHCFDCGKDFKYPYKQSKPKDQ